MRNGLVAAAATAGLLSTITPLAALLPAVPNGPLPAGGTATLALAADAAEAAPVDARLMTVGIEPVLTPDEPLAAEIDAAGLLKAVGLADVVRQAEETRAAREAAARCDADLDGLGRVTPFVRGAAQFLSCLYDQPDVLGIGQRSRASDHPRGLALDLMVRGEIGDRIAACALANQEALGVSYVIYEQRVNYGDGWERMSDRGGDTANHYDHVHVSFERGGGSGEALAALCED